MEYNWEETSKSSPPHRRLVLLQLEADDKMRIPSTVVVGYVTHWLDGRFYVTVGYMRNARRVTHYCDCLGDNFHAPLWENKDTNRSNSYMRNKLHTEQPNA